jgi:aminopeptidase N
LAANGQASAAELDAELARDTTASGRAGHATAMASRPDRDVKAAAWDAAVHGTGLSNQLLTATISGFTTAPPALLEPYVEPYFACLRAAWDSRSIEIASRIVRGLYPAAQDLADGGEPKAHPVVRRTDAWLDAHQDAPHALRRIFVEQRSHLLRALTAQAAVGPSSIAP